MLIVQGNHGEFLPFKGGGEKFDKRNVFDKGMLYLKAWAAKGGGNFWIKRMFLINGMLYLKAWAANAGGGGNFDKRNVCDKKNVVLESMTCQGGGKILIKGMILIKRMLYLGLNH